MVLTSHDHNCKDSKAQPSRYTPSCGVPKPPSIIRVSRPRVSSPRVAPPQGTSIIVTWLPWFVLITSAVSISRIGSGASGGVNFLLQVLRKVVHSSRRQPVGHFGEVCVWRCGGGGMCVLCVIELLRRVRHPPQKVNYKGENVGRWWQRFVVGASALGGVGGGGGSFSGPLL